MVSNAFRLSPALILVSSIIHGSVSGGRNSAGCFDSSRVPCWDVSAVLSGSYVGVSGLVLGVGVPWVSAAVDGRGLGAAVSLLVLWCAWWLI